MCVPKIRKSAVVQSQKMAEPGILETDFMHRFVRINLDVSEIPSPVPENNGAEENQGNCLHSYTVFNFVGLWYKP